MKKSIDGVDASGHDCHVGRYLCLEERVFPLAYAAHGSLANVRRGLLLHRNGQSIQQRQHARSRLTLPYPHHRISGQILWGGDQNEGAGRKLATFAFSMVGEGEEN